MAVGLLVAGVAAVLAGALLFTNAVEWAGSRAVLGVGAVGTLLAGVSTALPESAIPVLAVLRGDPRADEVAVGAIIGAPFMLATVAMARRFVLLYAAYVAVTIRHGGAAQQEHELEPLVADPTRHDPPAFAASVWILA